MLKNLFILTLVVCAPFAPSASASQLECEQWSKYNAEVESLEAPYDEFGVPSARFLLPGKLDQLIVSKTERKMIAFSNSQALKSYSVSLGQQPIGAKKQAGDMKTPEGQYYIEAKNPNSAYFLALQISYPNSRDKAMAMVNGIKDPGGQIMLHGFPVNPRDRAMANEKHATTKDWTEGCVAVTNSEIRELYQRVDVQTPILICP
jgi:murein L,D-transpeptidase YafK